MTTSQTSDQRNRGANASTSAQQDPRRNGNNEGVPSSYALGPAALSSVKGDHSRRGSTERIGVRSSSVGPLKGNSREPSVYEKLTSKYVLPEHPYRELVKDIPRRGCFNMSLHNPLRKAAILIMKSRAFEIFILLVILLNCVFMALQSKRPGFDKTNLARFLARAEIFFQVVFTSEMVMKIIALGFVLRKGSYLRDGFNVVDFIVVVLSYLNYVPGIGNYTAVRAVRVLRPLRTVTRIKGMRQLVLTLLNSLPLLFDVAILCAFLFFVYGIASVQLFGGTFRDHCSIPVFNQTLLATLPLGPTGTARIPDSMVQYIVPSEEADSFCSGPYTEQIKWFVNATGGITRTGGSRGLGRVCAGPSPDYPQGLVCYSGQNPYPGFINFDNILWAWLNVFIVITLDGWSDTLYGLQDSVSDFVWPFFISLIFLSSYFMVNLALAVLYTHFQKESEARKLKAAKIAAEREAAWQKEVEAIEKRLLVTEVALPELGTVPNASLVMSAELSSRPMGKSLPHHRELSAPPGSPPDPEQPLSAGPRPQLSVHVGDPSGDASVPGRKTRGLGFLSEPAKLNELGDKRGKRPSFMALPSFLSSGRSRTGRGSSLMDVQGRTISVLPMQRAASVQEARTVYLDLVQTHNEWQKSGVHITFRHRISLLAYKVLCQRWFEVLMAFLIVLNTIMMAAEHYGQSNLQTAFSTGINYAVTGIFAIELVVKHCAYGFKLYWTNGYDAFDGLILFASIIDIVVGATQQNGGASALSALRSLRLLRVLKLARSWKELQKVINAVLSAVGSIGYLSLLVMLFLTIFALLGMQMFGEQLQFCDDVEGSFQACPPGETCPRYRNCYLRCEADELGSWIAADQSPFSNLALCERFPTDPSQLKAGQEYEYLAYVGPAYVPRFMFDTFFFSLVTVFACIAQDGWSGIMFDVMRSVNGPGRYLSVIYFLFLLVIGLYILLNLFLAILLDGFSLQGAAEKEPSSVHILRQTIGSTSRLFAHKSKQFLSKVGSRMSLSMSKGHRSQGSTIDANSPSTRPRDEAPSSAPVRSKRLPHSAFATVGGDSNSHALASVSESGEPTADTSVAGNRKKSVGFHRKSVEDEVGLPRVRASQNGGSPNKDGAKSDQHEDEEDELSRAASHRSSRPPTIDDQISALKGRSLCIFEMDSPFRLFLARIVFHRMFDVLIMCVIVCSSLALALDSPELKSDSAMKKNLATLDIVFTACFATEAVLKIIVLGFAFHEGSYMRNGWNLLDIAVVAIGLVLISMPQDNTNRNVRSLRVLRTLRALRPLRLISWNAGMRIVVNSLFQSIPPLGDVLMVCILVYFIFGVIGIQLFAGLFYECVDVSSGNALDPRIFFPPGVAMTKEWCEANGGWHVFESFPYHYYRNSSAKLPADAVVVIQTAWQNPPTNFDNIGNALLTLYEVASLELWEVVMWRGMDATTENQQPKRDHFYLSAIYFMLFVMFGAFFILNLFVGVVIDKFGELKKKAEGQSIMLTEDQQKWVEIQKLMAIVGPKKTYSRPKNKFRAFCFDFILSPRTDSLIMGCVVLNVLQMAFEYFNSPYDWFAALSYINIVFTSIFFLEAALKLIAIGPKWYFNDRLNRFDFVIIISSFLTILLDYGPDGRPSQGQGGAGVNLLRVFRIVRILRLIPRATGLRTLIQTLLFSLPALWNVGSVMFMFFFIFAVMGMQLFGLNVGGQYIDNKCNFNSFPTALLTLFRSLTGENWPGVMHDAAGDTVQPQCIQMIADCSPTTVPPCGADFAAGSFYTPHDVARFHVPSDLTLDRCPGNRVIAIFYFCAFSVLCGFILLNLVIAIILDNFQASNLEENLPISKQHMTDYIDTWAQFDPSGSGYIPARKLPALIAELPHPMGAKNSAATLADIQMIIMTSDIPNRDGRVHFFETLHSLSARVAGTDLPFQEQIKVHSKLSSKLPRNAEETKHTVAHYHAALYVQAAVRGMLARQAVKQHLEQIFGETPPQNLNLPSGSLTSSANGRSSRVVDGDRTPLDRGSQRKGFARSLINLVTMSRKDRGSKIDRLGTQATPIEQVEAARTPEKANDLPSSLDPPAANPAAVAAASTAFKFLRKKESGAVSEDGGSEATPGRSTLPGAHAADLTKRASRLPQISRAGTGDSATLNPSTPGTSGSGV